MPSKSLLLAAALLSTASPQRATPALALFDYVASEADELTLRRGESLTILQTHTDDAGWARGRLGDGREGLLPLDYVRLLPDDAAPEPQRVAVGADGGAAHAWPDAEPAELEAVDDALRRYRSRVALYNGPAELLDRWGVHIDLEGSGLPLHRQAPPSGDEPLEHRSGVGGVPFFNLAEHMEPAVLSRELVRMLRSEWLPDYTPAPAAADAYDGWLPGLDDALRAAATPEGELILTFANLGYADFVLNGFPKAVVPHTLVIALDAEAHATFTAAGLVSYFDPRMPAIDGGAHDHRTAAFMDIMKLRLLYLAEVLLRGYSALLTDADAVFAAEPFAHFPADAALSVACDATVVPRDWAEAPGMVMAGFFFARAGPRPIILIKEILDYQARHPDQHDQQSFNQILSELLVADLSVAVMHPRLFPNGFQFFVKQTVQREGIAPVVVQNNWMMGADNKRHRFREAQMWSRDADEYYRGTVAAPLRLLLYDAAQPRVSGLLRETSALRSALSLARLLNRTLVLPPLCAFTPASGLVPAPPLEYRDRFGNRDTNVLDDAVDATWCTAEWFYDMHAFYASFGTGGSGGALFREASFLRHPKVPAALARPASPPPPPFFIDAPPAWRLVDPPAGASVLRPADAARGATAAELRRWLAPHADAPILRFGDLAGRFDPLLAPDGGGGGDDDEEGAAWAARLRDGVEYREEILRHVRQQVAAAAPFDCLCVQHDGVNLARNLTGVVAHYAARVPRDRTVFVAGHRVDLVGLDEFRAVWDSVYTLALYDWNGDGLQGRQFSSVINRLVCREAERVHSWVARVESTRECW